MIATITALSQERAPARPEPAPPAPPGTPAVTYVDITDQAGVDFVHRHGGSGQKYMVETMGSGAGIFDYDGDGRMDLYLVNGSALPGYQGPAPTNRLYRNLGALRFEDVTDSAGVAGRGWMMGVSFGDYDNDGDSDIYITALGPNILYRNDGGGRFTDVSQAAGVDSKLWGASAAFADYDLDGDLDLYVSNYVDFTLDNNKFCGNLRLQQRAYCHPDVYNGVPPVLYRNNGDGSFSDATRAAGLYITEGKGLGVVWTDVDGDGDPDLYGANDSTINYLFVNNGDGTFADESLFSGAGYSEDGKAMAGMGVDSADIDGDQKPELFVTNLDLETNTLYHNDGAHSFTDTTYRAGLGEPSLLFVGFGTAFDDYDGDGWQDIIVVNGHIIDNIHLFKDNITYAQRGMVFRNLGGAKFVEVTGACGAINDVRVSRGLALGDLDDDGDRELLISRNNDRAALLRNDGGNRGGWLRVVLRGRRSNRDGFGARVTLVAGGRTQVREARSANSYLSQSDPRLLFGLGGAKTVERLEVRWPSGQVDRLTDLEPGRTVTVHEGEKAPAIDR
ncbi:MAG TPA: CRTAC1 family protein [Acidobacteriota bacterium]